MIPGTSSFYGNWIEDVSAGQFIILGDFVGRCLFGPCVCLLLFFDQQLLLLVVSSIINSVVRDVISALFTAGPLGKRFALHHNCIFGV